jgi:hypothetical protein
MSRVNRLAAAIDMIAAGTMAPFRFFMSVDDH